MSNRESAETIVACLVNFMSQKADHDGAGTELFRQRRDEAKKQLERAIERALDDATARRPEPTDR